MPLFKGLYIRNYLETRGWKTFREGKLFIYFSPPEQAQLPEDFLLEIPRDDNDQGFDSYVKRLIIHITELLPRDANPDDLKILFTRQNSIIKFRIFDSDSIDGSIGFHKHLESLDSLKKVLSQSVTFVTTRKPIFGEAKFEVNWFLDRCRALQSEKGSYVSKIEVPDEPIFTTITEIDSTQVTNKLFDVFEFVDREILQPKNPVSINENYVQDFQDYLNFELLQSIRDFYSRGNINSVEYQLLSNKTFRRIETLKVQPRLKAFNQYLGDLKKLLLNAIPLEVVGTIRKLSSISPLHSKKNEILIDTEISNNKETVKVILSSDDYISAIEAHKNEWLVKAAGKARESKSQLTIYALEKFEVLKI